MVTLALWGLLVTVLIAAALRRLGQTLCVAGAFALIAGLATSFSWLPPGTPGMLGDAPPLILGGTLAVLCGAVVRYCEFEGR